MPFLLFSVEGISKALEILLKHKPRHSSGPCIWTPMSVSEIVDLLCMTKLKFLNICLFMPKYTRRKSCCQASIAYASPRLAYAAEMPRWPPTILVL